jgi:transcription antitermination factor NusG
MQEISESYPWYAIQVRPRYERIIASTLLEKGYEGFLPLYRCRRRWSDRIKELEMPLFSGYMFCRLDITRRLPVLKTPGVIRFIGIGKEPLPVDEQEMSAIISIVSVQMNMEPHPYLQVGQRVRIDHGTLAGVEGIVQLARKPARLVVSVSLLQRSVAVEIDESWLSPLSPAARIPLPQRVARVTRATADALA